MNKEVRHRHHRFTIDFENLPLKREELFAFWEAASKEQRREWLRTGIVPSDYPGRVASDWPQLLQIVEEKVRPIRLKSKRDKYKRIWWQFAERAVELRKKIQSEKLKSVIAINCGASPHAAFAFLPTGMIYSHTLAVAANDSVGLFSVLQSRVHEIWARFMSSSMKDDLRYTPSDCFETFAFPDNYAANSEVGDVGGVYYQFRAEAMERKNEGLTKTYNRFHNDRRPSADIRKLRELHDQMDRAVLDAYGWSDVRPVCEFFPEFEEDEEDESESRRPRVKKYRYRWPDEIHDEVLARLLALNQERAAQGR